MEWEGFLFSFWEGCIVLYTTFFLFFFLLIRVTNWVRSFVIFILSFVLWGKIVYYKGK